MFLRFKLISCVSPGYTFPILENIWGIIDILGRSNWHPHPRIQWRSSTLVSHTFHPLLTFLILRSRSHEERKFTIALTRKTLDDNGFQNVVVVAGTGAQSTRETKKLNVDAHEAGASFALVLTPGVWPKLMTVDNILRFHREVGISRP